MLTGRHGYLIAFLELKLTFLGDVALASGRQPHHDDTYLRILGLDADAVSLARHVDGFAGALIAKCRDHESWKDARQFCSARRIGSGFASGDGVMNCSREVFGRFGPVWATAVCGKHRDSIPVKPPIAGREEGQSLGKPGSLIRRYVFAEIRWSSDEERGRNREAVVEELGAKWMGKTS